MVVLATIFILLGLLLPALANVRDAARRAQCVDNLSQIALGLQQYANIYETLPPGVVNDSGPIKNRPSGYHHGWLTQILPHLDRGDVSGALDTSVSIYAPENSTCRQVLIGVLTCPSSLGNRVREPDGVAATSYAGCHHDRETPIAANNNGVLFLNSAIRHDDISDGTSHTIVVGEKPLLGGELGWASGTRASLRNADFFWSATGPGLAVPLLTLIPASESNEDAADAVGGGVPDPVGGFGSHHRLVVNFAFCDGSVHVIASKIDRAVFRALATRAGGEVYDDDSF
jgi:prepilin-type processing-associated H-X9-DG protein